jgi:RNA polymerase sigma-70 factor (ECF subfamily)
VSDRNESDAVLIGRIVNGEPDAARSLVERYTPLLRRMVLRTGVPAAQLDDVLQETWIRVVRSAARYNPMQPFPRWLFTIAVNRVRTCITRDKAESMRQQPIDRKDEPVAQTPPADAILERAQLAAAVRAQISTLSPRLAEAILLRFFEEMSEKEMAEQLGVPVGTVKSRLHNAIQKLKSSFERNGHAQTNVFSNH